MSRRKRKASSVNRASLIKRVTVLLYRLNPTRADVTDALSYAVSLLDSYPKVTTDKKRVATAVSHISDSFKKRLGSRGFDDDLESALHELSKVDPDAYDRGVHAVDYPATSAFPKRRR